MNKQQPQIRVIDPGSEYFGDKFTVQEMSYQYKQILVTKGAHVWNFSDVQELTPLSHDGVRIGVGDKVKAEDGADGEVIDYVNHEVDPAIWVEGMSMKLTWQNITDHTPLTELKEEENKPHQPEKEKWEYEPRKDCILCDLEERGGMVHSNVHFSHHDKLEKEDNDKPTIERIDRPDPYDRHSDNMVSLDVPEVAAVLIEMFEQQKEILEALADSGIINLEDNNE